MTEVSSSRPRQFLRIAIIVAVAIHLTSAAFHIFFGALSVDEGFYAIATRAVMEGEIPYRDFGYTQMPLLLYVNGPLLSLTGYGLFEQRLINGLWGLVALGIGCRLVTRFSNPFLGVVLAIAFSTSPTWMYFIHLGKTYGFVSFVVVLATGAFWVLKPGWKKFWLMGVLGVVGTGCRLPAAPFFAILWLAALWRNHRPSRRDFLQASGGLVVSTGLLLLPFFLLAPENTRFWPLEFQLSSVLEKKWRVPWEDIATLAPGWWIALTAILFLSFMRRRLPHFLEFMPAWAALVTLGLNLLPAGAYEEYGVPFVLPMACACIRSLHGLAATWRPAKMISLLAVLSCIHLAAPPFLTLYRGQIRPGLSLWLPSTAPNFDGELPVNLARARRVVKRLLPAGNAFIGPNLILAAETGHPVPPNLRMGPFTMTRDFDPEKARRLHLMTYPELTSIFTDPATSLIAFFPSSSPNYSWSMPSFRNQPEAERQQWAALFRQDFVLVEESSEFLLLARRSSLPIDPPR